MRRAVFYIFGMTLSIFLMTACALPTRVDKNFGKSVKQAQINQILDPEGERNLEPVIGLDGNAAQAGIKKYRKAFEQSHEGPPSLVQTGAPVGLGE